MPGGQLYCPLLHRGLGLGPGRENRYNPFWLCAVWPTPLLLCASVSISVSNTQTGAAGWTPREDNYITYVMCALNAINVLFNGAKRGGGCMARKCSLPSVTCGDLGLTLRSPSLASSAVPWAALLPSDSTNVNKCLQSTCGGRMWSRAWSGCRQSLERFGLDLLTSCVTLGRCLPSLCLSSSPLKWAKQYIPQGVLLGIQQVAICTGPRSMPGTW